MSLLPSTRFCLPLAGVLLLGVAAAAQPIPSAPDPAAPSRGGVGPLRDTHGEKHPRVRKERSGDYVFRNQYLVAVLRHADNEWGPLVVYPASRPSQPASAPVAIVPVMARFAWKEGAETVNESVVADQVRASGDNRLILSGHAKGWTSEVELSISDDPWISWSARARPGGAVTLTEFTPMPVEAGHEGPREALLPGVFYVEGTEGQIKAEQNPDPYWITVPVMALAQEDTTVAVMWENREGTSYPGVRFQTPAGDTHKMELSLPTPQPGKERESALSAGSELHLAGKLAVLRDQESPGAVVRRWAKAYADRIETDIFGQTHTPSNRAPRSFDVERKLTRPALDRLLNNHADVYPEHVTGTEIVAQHLDLALLRSSAAQKSPDATSSTDAELAYRFGGVAESWTAERSRIEPLLRSQLANGSWPLKSPPAPRRLSGLPPLETGKPADVEVGMVTERALPILSYAAITGDSEAVGAGIRALEYIDRFTLGRPYSRFRVPRVESDPVGPDLFTAAQAAECFLLGYQATGEDRYLTSARYWADTGLPFIYFWGEKARPAMKGAAIPEFELHGWGQPHQYGGLGFAYVLQELSRVRRDELYDHVARWILASAEEQQYTTGKDAGLLPEHWSIRDNNGSGLRGVDTLLAVLYGLEGYDVGVSHVRERVGPDRIWVASGATIERPDTSAMRLRLNLQWVQGEETYTTITGVQARPISVTYNNLALPVLNIRLKRNFLNEADRDFGPGWYYDEEAQLLTLRLKHTAGQDHVEVRWPDPKDRTPIRRMDTKVKPRR